jgi:hypothetical protein
MLLTPAQDYVKLFAANQTGAAIAAPPPTTTAPTGDGMFSSAPDVSYGEERLNSCGLVFYGAGADNSTFTARVTGWRKVGALWVPVPLLALSGVFGSAVGVAAADVLDTERFADTLTASTGYTSAYELISPADNTVACAKVDFFGCQFVQVQVARGTATSVNVLATGF